MKLIIKTVVTICFFKLYTHDSFILISTVHTQVVQLQRC